MGAGDGAPRGALVEAGDAEDRVQGAFNGGAAGGPAGEAAAGREEPIPRRGLVWTAGAAGHGGKALVGKTGL